MAKKKKLSKLQYLGIVIVLLFLVAVFNPTLLGLGSITGNTTGYVNQAYSYNVSLDSNVNPQSDYTLGNQTVLVAQTRVIDSSGNFVFTSPQVSLTTKNYFYSFSWTPTAVGKYVVVSVILEKHATFNRVTGQWGAWSNQTVTGQETLGVDITSIGAPATPTFDIGQFFSGIINGIVNFFKGLFGL